MKISPVKVSRSGETVLIPPKLPSYLSDTHTLKPIVGKPTDDNVKAIHAAIRTQNAMALLPKFHNLDLSMQLSQHLFGAQMAIYKASYSMSLLPGDKSVYTPPDLPSHIPSTLEKVVGTPSDGDIKTAQSALRSLDSLSHHPQLFDEGLSMKLSQHVFNLQFARYMHDAAQGEFASDSEIEESLPVPEPTQEPQEIPSVNLPAPNPESEEQTGDRNSQPEPVSEPPSELVQLADIMKAIKDTMDGSKEVLENMNRIVMSIKRDQSVIHHKGPGGLIRRDPLNRHGMIASERGLPLLSYSYDAYGGKYYISLTDNHIARYLKFFDLGADLIKGDEKLKLVDGKRDEAVALLLAQIGI